ncbi:MAG TPA: 50S ribosomal protein L13 [Candidatus Paceibacterota bacterium]
MEYVIDAKGKTLGRLATKIAGILQGKTDAKYAPRKRGDNTVVIKNISLLKVTGNKAQQKIYYRHTGYVGHLKERRYEEAFSRSPEWVLKHAVAGMLPKNALRQQRLKMLKVEK